MTTADPALSGLLRAVLAEPGDDALRLIYADRLEELAGGPVPRAEFVRVQVELAQREADGRDRSECSWGGTCCCRSHVLVRRERELLADHGYGWCDGLAGEGWKTAGDHKADAVCVRYGSPKGYVSTGPVEVRFARGFPDLLRLSSEDWLAHADAFTAAAPVAGVALADLPRYTLDSSLGRRWGIALTADLGSRGRCVTRLPLNYDLPEIYQAVVNLLQQAWRGIAFSLPR